MLADLYSISLDLIETYSALDTSSGFACYATFYSGRSLILAAFVILKLLRAVDSPDVDRVRGESCYFRAVQLLQRRAVNFPDLDTKAADILTDLWSSQNAFCGADGVINGLKLRIRSRLVSFSKFESASQRQVYS